MPLDYLSLYNQKNQDLTDLLARQGQAIPDQLASTRARAVASRQPINNMAQGLASGLDPSYGGAFQAALAEQTPRLNRQLDSTLAAQKYNQEVGRQNLVFQHGSQMAQDSGMNLQDANQFARTYLANQKGYQFQASEADKERQAELYRDSLANEYAKIGIGQQNAYANSTLDPTAAYLRVLLGTGTALGTAYAMRKYGNKPPAANPTSFAGVSGNPQTSTFDSYYPQTAGANGYGY